MRRFVPVVALALVAACTSTPAPTTTSTSAAPSTTTTTAVPPTATTSTTGPVAWVIPAGLSLRPFGDFTEIPLITEGSYRGPATPTSLAGVRVFDPVAPFLDDPAVTETLTANGFVVVPGTSPLFHKVYEESTYDGTFPVFLTTDAAYHVWHLTFDKILRETEQQRLLPRLEELVSGLVARARLQEADLAGTPLAEPADRVTQFYEAAATVLEIDVGPIGPLAEQEVTLILDHREYTASPITSYEPCEPGASPANCVDYSLYKPRGHYTRNAELERYFRAMSVLGNSAFFLDAYSLRLGLLASRVLLSDPALIEAWQDIYEPTAFLVGAADDYTPFEAARAAAQVTPDGLTAPIDFAEEAVLAEVAAELRAHRPILINPEAPSVRIMGVRLVLDSYIYDQLVHPAVPNRMEASPLDLAAAFGSEWADERQREAGVHAEYPEYLPQLTDMQDLVNERTAAQWGATVYDAWLYALEPMWAEHGAPYPDFMRTEAWAAKAHQTGFGSYAELKHDTILYAKQAIAEFGLEPPLIPPRHWVEPDPVAFLRLAAAARLLADGLGDRGLVITGEAVEGGTHAALLTDVVEWLERLARIAQSELQGLPISDDDSVFLGSIGGRMEQFWIRTSDWDHGEEDGPDSMSALVADVMRNPGQVLELGTGYVDTILVLVPADDGVFQVALGGVYSYYEFWQDAENRLSDEEWRAMLTGGEAPARPDWQEVFLAPAP